MPPFTTLNGQTGYYMNGQFVPATQQEYDAQFNQQQTQNNPFLQQVLPQNIQPPLMGGRQNFVQQGTIQGPETTGMTNEQKVMQAQGDDTPMLGNMPYGMTDQGLGIQRGKSFFPYNASTASGHPLNTVTNTVFNAYDLMASKKGKVVNPFASEVSLIQSQNTQNALNALNNPVATTAPAAPTQQINMPEISSTATNAISSAGNKIGSQVGSAVSDVVDKGLKSDVLGSGKLGFSGKEFFKSDAGQATSAIAGAGVGLITGLVKAGAQDKYDPRVGMSKPNLGGNLFGDATFTQVGLNPLLMGATGGLSAVVGGGVDLIKNAVKYAKQKDRYENKKLATDTMQSIDDARENMKPDYTGYARFGTQVTNPYIKKFNPGGEINSSPTYSWGSGSNQSLISQLAPLNKEYAVGTTIPNKVPLTDEQIKQQKIDLINKKQADAYFSNPINQKANIEMAMQSFNNMNVDGLDNQGNKIPYDKNYTFGRPLKEIQNEAVSQLTDIYSSPGFRKKVMKEIEESKKLGYGETYNFSNNVGEPLNYSYYDATKTADDYINEKLYRIKNTPVSILDKDDERRNNVYGLMGARNFIWDYPYIKMNPDHYGFPKSTLIEELEHASHIKKESYKSGYTNQNITPYAKYILDNHAPSTSDAAIKRNNNNYMDKYTEKMAKKRATEIYLMDNNLLKEGEDVTIDHYNFLLGNYGRVPKNVKDLLDMISENKDIQHNIPEIENSNKNILKMYEADEMMKSKNPTYFKSLERNIKNSKKTKENFFKVMNGIAMNLNNPYIQTARFGIFIKPENKGKFTKWAQDKNMGVQEAANTVMENKEEYRPEIVKMANFAKNAKKWN